jgi:hypothetical protein
MDEIEKNKEPVKKIKDTIRHISQYLQQNGFTVSESNTILTGAKSVILNNSLCLSGEFNLIHFLVKGRAGFNSIIAKAIVTEYFKFGKMF